MKDTIDREIGQSRSSLQDLQAHIQTYDKFIAQFGTQNTLEYALYTGEKRFSIALFDGDAQILDEKRDNLMTNYLDLQDNLLSKYRI
jgi:hypothetical protein